MSLILVLISDVYVLSEPSMDGVARSPGWHVGAAELLRGELQEEGGCTEGHPFALSLVLRPLPSPPASSLLSGCVIR